MDPFFQHVALHHSSQQHRHCVNRKEKTQGQRYQKDRKQVFQMPIDVFAIERPFMMAKVSWVKKLMRQVSEILFIFPGGHRPVAMKYPAMRSVFGKRPQRDAQQKENERLVRMTGTRSQYQHDHRKHCVESRNWIELAARNARLRTFVSAGWKNAMATRGMHGVPQ